MSTVGAVFRGKEIGEVTIHLDEFSGTSCINRMFVDDEYLRNGVGLRLIEALHGVYGVLGAPPEDGPNAMTFEGAALVNAAVAMGWVHGRRHDEPDEPDFDE